MTCLRTLEEALHRFPKQVFWREPHREKTYDEFVKDLNSQRALGPGGGLWLGYGLPIYEQLVLAFAAMRDGWTYVPLSPRYSWSQLEVWRRQVPFRGTFSPEGCRVSDDSPSEQEQGEIEQIKACLCIYTSGSSGTPKAIAHTVDSLITSAEATLQFYDMKPRESYLLSLDVSHIGGFQIALRCILGGLTCLGGFLPHEIDKALAFYPDVNYLSLVPTQLQRLLDNQVMPQSSLRGVLLGGAASSTFLVQEALRVNWPVSVTYGSTETASQISACPVGVMPQSQGDVGQLLSVWEGEQTESGVILRGISLCKGWWQERKFFSLSARAGLLLPDKARLGEHGLYLEGRRDDIFQVGGENLAPREVLDLLEPLAPTGTWILLPVTDAVYGSIPILIYRGSKVPPSQEQIETVLKERLPRLKWPRSCYWHRTEDVLKPSKDFYQEALSRGELECLWTQNKASMN